MGKKKAASKRTRRQSSSSKGRVTKRKGGKKRQTKGIRPAGQRSQSSTDGYRVVYIHGIGEQDRPATLKRSYDLALFGRDVGERSRMAYWADILHPMQSSEAGLRGIATQTDPKLAALFVENELNEEGWAFAENLAEKMLANLPDDDEEEQAVAELAEAGGFQAKILPPGSFRRWLTRKITEAFIKDVSAYFYDADVRERIQSRFESVVVPGGGPYVIVSHSLGTVVAYDVLSRLGDDVDVGLFVTLGSPLGISEVQDQIAQPLEVPDGVQTWRNFADRLDPVALDPGLGNEFEPDDFIDDELVINLHTRRLRGFNPHSSLGYLGHPDVRAAVDEFVSAESIARTRSFVVAKDLADDMIGESDRMPVLIEVVESGKECLQTAKEAIIQEIEDLTDGATEDEVELHELRRFVAANLTAEEIFLLEARHKELAISRLWRNAEKQALMNVSTHCVQAYTAQVGYKATGKRIAWAVLDTGIAADHPHFQTHENVVESWDCTKSGPIQPGGTDRHGHGTHVAGIIAGREENPPDDRDPYVGMAPETKLHSYKVLRDNGSGRDAYIIKALDHIAGINEAASDLVIHGVNLSLGGPFDVEVYGCGHSPICEELRRLWRMGVVVCVAAGNEGFAVINTQGGPTQINLDLSIGDPANLEEAIAVGSVHKEQPRFYGVSYFSSRGPTADGRRKPDVVAPGEKIMSCNVRGGDDYVALSGTSMACPHVSGILAGFLSVRREFIGRPDEVKRTLLEHSEDLHRDHYHQGAGMPNLIKMLAGGLPQA